MKKVYKVFLMLTIIVAMFYVPCAVSAKENMIPNYEVKLLLNSETVLNSENELNEEYKDFFSAASNYQNVSVAYVDTPDKAFNAAGWTNRIRIKENAKKFELAYKKRYEIVDYDMDAALSATNKEGFDVSDDNYEAQIDWGYNNMTLSITRKKDVTNKGYGNLELPNTSDTIEILKDKMPNKENNWLYENWGTALIETGKKYGDVYCKKYSGVLNDIEVDIEIWELVKSNKTEYITELSFKEDTYAAAERNRNKITSLLDEKGVLLHKDALKTQTILNMY